MSIVFLIIDTFHGGSCCMGNTRRCEIQQRYTGESCPSLPVRGRRLWWRNAGRGDNDPRWWTLLWRETFTASTLHFVRSPPFFPFIFSSHLFFFLSFLYFISFTLPFLLCLLLRLVSSSSLISAWKKIDDGNKNNTDENEHMRRERERKRLLEGKGTWKREKRGQKKGS